MTATTAIPAHVPRELVSDFNFFTAEGMAPAAGGDPHLAVQKLRDGPRIFYSPNNTRDGQGTWILTHIDDMREVLRDTDTFSSHRSIFASAIGENWPMIPLEIDPPDHSSFRKLLNPLFSPQRMEKLESMVRERAVGLIDSFKDKGGCEVMSEFAFPYAVGIFLDFLGLPKERMDQFIGWANSLLHPHTPAERTQAAHEVIAYLDGLAALRRTTPADDFVTLVLNTTVDGRALTDMEIRGISILVFIAGLDTVAAGIGFDLSHLARNLEDQRQLREHPEMIPNAVEEMLRAYSTVQMVRVAKQDTVLAGAHIKAGDLISCPSMLANRDPNEFADPDTIDFTRKADRHMAFAYGVHRCLGSHLARRELIASLEEWLKRIPEFRVKEGTAPVAHGGFVFGVNSLEVRWD